MWVNISIYVFQYGGLIAYDDAGFIVKWIHKLREPTDSNC